jgi:hypothetical protein
MTDMQPGWIQVISEPRNFNPDNAIEQIMADDPPVWFKFDSSTSMTNSGSGGSTWDGLYTSPPITQPDGPMTIDAAATNKSLRVNKNVNVYPNSAPRITATIDSTGSPIVGNKSQWDVTVSYVVGNVVYWRPGSSGAYTLYISILNGQGYTPTNTTYWQVFTPDSTDYPLSLPTREPWTFEFWIKTTNTVGYMQNEYHSIIAGKATTGEIQWRLSYNSPWASHQRFFSFEYGQWGTVRIPLNHYVSGVLEDYFDVTEWHHLAFTNSGSSSWSSSGRKSVYFDGELIMEYVNGVWSLPLPTAGPLVGTNTGLIYVAPENAYIHLPGAENISFQSDTERGLSGSSNRAEDTDLAHVCFYDRELSSDRIRSHYTAAP